MFPFIIKTPAKINLGLNIVSKRKDGFHNIETFFYPLNNLYDMLTFTFSSDFTFTSNNKNLNNERNNLILKAHKLLEKVTRKKLNVTIKLEKKIPIGAGLGGGSSDAACTLTSLNNLFKLKLSFNQLLSMALQLGSDVPFFLKSVPAVGKSRGEILEYSNIKITKPILIVNPGIHISTEHAFQNITFEKNIFNYKYFLNNEKINYIYLKENLTNDFEKFIFAKYPSINKIKTTMYNSGALFSLMSGTGSTVYGIFETKKDANNCKNLFPDNYFKVIV